MTSLVDFADPLEFDAFNWYFPASDSFAESISNATVPSGFWLKWTFSDSLTGTSFLVHSTFGLGTPSILATNFTGFPSAISIFDGRFSLIIGIPLA